MKILITESQLENISDQVARPEIRPMTHEDFYKLEKHLGSIFPTLPYTNEELGQNILERSKVEDSAALFLGDQIIGFYFINYDRIPYMGNVELYKPFTRLKGAEGVSLGIIPKYKELGLGKMLIDWSQKLPVDYIWGGQDKSLGNLHNWQKRREIYHEGTNFYITYQLLSDKAKNMFQKHGEMEIGEEMEISKYRPLFSEFN